MKIDNGQSGIIQFPLGMNSFYTWGKLIYCVSIFHLWIIFIHYNNSGLFCDPHIIANNKERGFRKPAFANHNSSQNLKLLRYQNIRTRTIASPSQLSNLTQSQNFSDYNCIYILFASNITSKIICSKPITATT